MDKTTLLYPVYKCRLCGETSAIGEVYTRDEALDIIFGEESQKPRMTETHRCSGPYAGSFGVADFLGYRKKG